MYLMIFIFILIIIGVITVYNFLSSLFSSDDKEETKMAKQASVGSESFVRIAVVNLHTQGNFCKYCGSKRESRKNISLYWENN